MRHLLKSLKNDIRGTAAVEYGFLCAMIVLAIISAIGGMAEETSGMWNVISSKSAEAIAD